MVASVARPSRSSSAKGTSTMRNQNKTAAMRTLILATAAVLGLAAGTASAAEVTRMPPQYNVVGNPFPYSAAQSRVTAAPPAFDTGSQAYPASDGQAMPVVVGQEMPPNNNEGTVQTANSLPPGYAAGGATVLAGAVPAARAQQTAGSTRTGGRHL